MYMFMYLSPASAAFILYILFIFISDFVTAYCVMMWLIIIYIIIIIELYTIL